MQKFRLALTALLVACLGCASGPKKIGAAYVSPLKYKDHDCEQIAMEMDYVSRRTTELYHSLKKASNNDKWQMGVGLILFWPTLFALEGGDGPEASEYAQLKGEYEALRQAAIEKKCSMEAMPPSPEELIKQQDGQEPESVQ